MQPVNKKPAGAYRASGLMSAILNALLKPPRARTCTVMMVMGTVVSRGKPHGETHYTRGAKNRQARHTSQSYDSAMAARLSRKAVMVRAMSASEWAAETNSASNCDGARKIPRLSMALKNAAKRFESDVFAPA